MLAVPGPPPEEVPVDLMRAAHDAESEQYGGPPEPVAEIEETEAGGVPATVLRPDGARGRVAYLHGGGWVVGTRRSFEAALCALANAARAEVVFVDYRLAPEHPFPAALEDSLAAVRALADRGGPLAVAGDSAGGNLATVVARRLKDEVPLRLQALIYPVTDAGLNTPSYRTFSEAHGLTAAGMRRFWELYLDGADGLRPDASPLRADDLAGSPPALVLTADEDVLRDEGELYAEVLRRAGVPVTARRVEGTIHGYWRWQAASAAARRTVAEVGAALRAALD